MEMINLKTPFKNEEEVKRIKVMSLDKWAGTIFEERKDFCAKKLLPSQVSELIAGSLEGTAPPPPHSPHPLPIRSRGVDCQENLEISFS